MAKWLKLGQTILWMIRAIWRKKYFSNQMEKQGGRSKHLARLVYINSVERAIDKC